VSRERRPRAAKRHLTQNSRTTCRNEAAGSDRPATIEKIISGGQTGVDRAALDVALAMGIDCGGWCPKGRRAEDGHIPSRYPLTETSSATYSQRTKRNVRESDATLILLRGEPRGGTLLTQRTAKDLEKPCLAVNVDSPASVAEIREWLLSHAIRVLNVAGPRESQSPGIAKEAARLLRELFSGDSPPSAATRRRR
jgi:hypothetical protein